MDRIDELFNDIKEIERAILGDEKYDELVDRYAMKQDAKRDLKREKGDVYNWNER
jgi:hypothetical protein